MFNGKPPDDFWLSKFTIIQVYLIKLMISNFLFSILFTRILPNPVVFSVTHLNGLYQRF